ncbi:hypothetical protein ACVRZG_02655 [Streptococcus hyovaginalis]|uniref:hypothetical protein n=1 Tax=Streptococcus hyovaginalis TaxID=149015 RepID=UPI00041CA6A8|nr:hypothetical protein [Streptococcus hyovaginalis]QBX25460.1 hypothetical protein Javan258_0053 [Streptococcus phage Javan258]
MSESKKAPRAATRKVLAKNYLLNYTIKMNDLDDIQELLLANWQRKFHPLSEVLINSLVGLSLYDTLMVLAMARKGHYG